MSTPVSRRTVARGAAWSVPVLAFGAAVPAMAASPSCPVPVSTRSRRLADGNLEFTITFATGVDPTVPTCMVSFTATKRTPPGPALTYTLATGQTFCVTSATGAAELTFTATPSSNTANYQGTYDAFLAYSVGGVTCPTRGYVFPLT